MRACAEVFRNDEAVGAMRLQCRQPDQIFKREIEIGAVR